MMKKQTTLELVESYLKKKRSYMTTSTIVNGTNKSKSAVSKTLLELEASGTVDVLYVFNGKTDEKAYLHEDSFCD